MDNKRGDGGSPARATRPASERRTGSAANSAADSNPPRGPAPGDRITAAAGGIPFPPQTIDTPHRTHRTWLPKYGRVQKCDFCNARSQGTLYVCQASGCFQHICEACCRNGRLLRDSLHFIDADAVDWTVKKVTRPTKTRGAKRGHAASLTPPPASGEGRSARPRPKARVGDTNSEEDDDYGYDGRKHGRLPAPATARHEAGRHSLAPLGVIGNYQSPAFYHQPTYGYPVGVESAIVGPPPHPTISAPLTRLGVRQAVAPVALDIGEQSRRSSRVRFEEDGDEDADTGYENEDAGATEEDGHGEKGSAGNVNDTCPGDNRLSKKASARNPTDSHTAHGNTSSPQTAAPGPGERPPATLEGRDHLVLSVYEWIYSNRPALDHDRVRTQIPDRWNGGWPTSVPQHHRERSPYGPTPHGAPHHQPPHTSYGQYHREVSASTAQFHPHIPPHSPGYPHHTFHSYPVYPHDTSYPTSGLYAPTSLTAPTFHLHSERTPADIHLPERDSLLLQEMQHAWRNNPLLLRLVGDGGHRLYAIELLWDVCELRRMRVLVRDFSQTVRWFVAERDSQFRAEYQQLYQQHQQSGRQRYDHGHDYGRGCDSHAEARSALSEAQNRNAAATEAGGDGGDTEAEE